ncbi:MAG: uncharacterized protein KVP18_003833 [Porospora cf. gigantea A]|uniref:uncharacterized protein n=1 Tax=Porospora cf. gigantea A TaxID=2853593 RepID=UPI00355A383C|nr:MAG: hypothetical protein KVP18_003833 [Porospora cf. gigantea A]
MKLQEATTGTPPVAIPPWKPEPSPSSPSLDLVDLDLDTREGLRKILGHGQVSGMGYGCDLAESVAAVVDPDAARHGLWLLPDQDAVGCCDMPATSRIPSVFPNRTVTPQAWASDVCRELDTLAKLIDADSAWSMHLDYIETTLLTPHVATDGFSDNPFLEFVESESRAQRDRLESHAREGVLTESTAWTDWVERTTHEPVSDSVVRGMKDQNPFNMPTYEPVLRPPGYARTHRSLRRQAERIDALVQHKESHSEFRNSFEGCLQVDRTLPFGRFTAASNVFEIIEDQVQRDCLEAASRLCEDDIARVWNQVVGTETRKSRSRKSRAKRRTESPYAEDGRVLMSAIRANAAVLPRLRRMLNFKEVVSLQRLASPSLVYRGTVDGHHEAVRRLQVPQNWVVDPHVKAVPAVAEGPRLSRSPVWSMLFPAADPPTMDAAMVETGEVLLRITMHMRKGRMPLRTVVGLGSQTLAELKDLLYCDEDVNQSRFKGACMWIGNDFFSDMRHTDVCYSTPIVDWRLRASHQCGPVRSMHEVKLKDVAWPIRTTVAYLHQGDCEHRLTLDNMELFNRETHAPYRKSYPLRVWQPAVKLEYCGACRAKLAVMLVFQTTLVKENPFKLCNECFDRLCLDEEGEYVEGMTAFEYQMNIV